MKSTVRHRGGAFNSAMGGAGARCGIAGESVDAVSSSSDQPTATAFSITTSSRGTSE